MTCIEAWRTNPSRTRRIKEIFRVCLYDQEATAGAYKQIVVGTEAACDLTEKFQPT